MENPKLWGPGGLCLNIQEDAGLETALLDGALKNNLPKLEFWGKITGTTSDYLIAVGYSPEYPFPKKTFFWTTTSEAHELKVMKVLDDDYAAHAKTLLNTPFTGDPATPYEIVRPEGYEPPPPKTDENGEPIPPEEFREEHKLAYHVSVIDNEVSIIPKGAWICDATHQVIRNVTNCGLTHEAAGSLRNYLHFRYPENDRSKQALVKPGVVRHGDFLDNLEDDQPKGCWGVHYDPTAKYSIVRSFYWPGSYFCHEIKTGNYVSVYFGDGLPNEDILFML
jgi:radial spoke head protein 9